MYSYVFIDNCCRSNGFLLSNINTNNTVVWCNGSTKDFGSFSTSSTLVTTTSRRDDDIN